MKLAKLIGIGVANGIFIVGAFIVVGNILCYSTGQYIDRMNLSSVTTIFICLVLLNCGASLESKYLKLPFVSILLISVCTVAFGGFGLAIMTNIIAGGLG